MRILILIQLITSMRIGTGSYLSIWCGSGSATLGGSCPKLKGNLFVKRANKHYSKQCCWSASFWRRSGSETDLLFWCWSYPKVNTCWKIRKNVWLLFSAVPVCIVLSYLSAGTLLGTRPLFFTGSRGDRGLRHGDRQAQRAIRHSQHNIQVGLLLSMYPQSHFLGIFTDILLAHFDISSPPPPFTVHL